MALKSAHIGPPSDTPKSVACFEPVASITARTSSMRTSRLGMSETRSERPVPRLSNRITRENEASRVKNRTSAGSSQNTSMFETHPNTKTMSRGPSPTTW